MEQKILTEKFKQEIKNKPQADLFIYLNEGFKLKEESILKAIEYFKKSLPIGLKEIVLNQEFWNGYYNSNLKEFILKSFEGKGIKLNEQQNKIIETFVYTFQVYKREFEEREQENILREKLLSEGFKEQDILNIEDLKKLHDLKVICVLDISKIGLMGSFDIKETIEGKLIFNNNIYLMPKRHSKTGVLIRKNFYFKIAERGKP